jgi:uncharacterized protein (TIGR00297 family)
MTTLLLRALGGLAMSCVIAWVARRRRSLAPSGAAAAVGVGTAIAIGGGAWWFAALVLFFVTSTLLGRVGRAHKEAVKREFEKGDTRDAWQVLANGGAAAAAALVAAVAPSPLCSAAFLGALATANGDTWATELGVLSRGDPISPVSLQRVPRGTSGAVSLLGLAATVAGAALIGALAALGPGAFGLPAWRGALAAIIGGVVGALGDSLLGATLQAGFHCEVCDRNTEGALHHCGAATRHERGLAWFDNDWVNAAATLVGALAAIAVALF